VKTVGVPFDVQQAGPDAVARYLQMVNAGESPRLAEMLALQRPPASETDKDFNRGLAKNMVQAFGERGAERRAIALAKKGYRLGQNELYNPMLASDTNSPDGIERGRAYRKQVMEQRRIANEKRLEERSKGIVKPDAEQVAVAARQLRATGKEFKNRAELKEAATEVAKKKVIRIG
jgi:hypothetical protein